MSQEFEFLTGLVGSDRIAFDAGARERHATDWGTEDGTEPDVVVQPTTTEEVSAILSAATERDIPVTPYAAGTSLEGNPVPVYGGISLDLTLMDDIRDIRPDDLQIDVEPGVIGADINAALEEYGLFFPPLPSSGDISTIGGMIANSASGMQTVKYGEIADWVLELEAVLADGSVIKAGSKAVKTSSGYNLRDVLIGSEGTLAVVTRATLELAGRPQQIKGARALFSDSAGATAAVADAVQSGVDMAKIELIDRESARLSNEYTGGDLPDVPMVFLEFHADHGVDEEIEFCRTIFEAHGLDRFEVASESEMNELWRARKDLAMALDSYDPDLETIHPGDVTVPISEYGSTFELIKQLADERGLVSVCFGHAGDGNIHYNILVDPDDPEAVERELDVHEAIIEHVIEVGGTITGEHGVGLGKREYLEAEHGEDTVETMRAIKRALDPTDTLNPGKIFPETIEGDRVR